MTVRTSSTDGSEAANLLAIANDNSWLHVYPDVHTMLLEDDIGTGGDHAGGIEFFDNEGHRLAPIFSPKWGLVGLTTAEDKADPDYVRARMRSVVDHVRRHLDRHRTDESARLKRHGLTAEQAGSKLPDLADLNLAESLRAFLPGPDDDGFEHDGSWMHNLLHRTGWTHD
jgi:hypothetical protein